MRKIMPFIEPEKTNKIHRNKPTQKVKYFYNENFKTLKKEIKH
jgi:hypothetical protein